MAKKEGWWLRNNLQISWNLALCLQRPGHHNYSQSLWLIRKSPIDTVLIFQFSCLSKIKLTFQLFSASVWNLAQNFRQNPTMIFLSKTIVWLTVSGGIISSLRMNVMIRCAAFKRSDCWLFVLHISLSLISWATHTLWFGDRLTCVCWGWGGL